jgi:hypothetical protein
VTLSLAFGKDELRRHVEGLVEHGEESVALALENLEAPVGNELHRSFQTLDARKWVAIAAQEEGWAPNRRQVLSAELVGEAWSMKRI